MSYKTGTNNRVALGGQARRCMHVRRTPALPACVARAPERARGRACGPGEVSHPARFAARQQLVYDTGTEPP